METSNHNPSQADPLSHSSQSPDDPATSSTSSQHRPTTEMTRLSFGLTDEVAAGLLLNASNSADLSHNTKEDGDDDGGDENNNNHNHNSDDGLVHREHRSTTMTMKHDNLDPNNSNQHTNHEREGFHLWHEASLLLNIALPSVAVQFSVLFIFPQTASAVGLRYGSKELAGFSLGSLVGNLTCLSVMVGALTAADTLMPRAFAAGRYPEVGRLAIRGFVMCSFLLVLPILPLCTIMERIFDVLGQDPTAASLASKWIRVYLLGVPAMLLFRCIQSFLVAQHQVWPLVVGSTISCFVVHPIILKFFLNDMGFMGSGAAISVTQYIMVGIVLLYLFLKPVHKAETWPGLSADYMKESLRPLPVLQFLSLSLGGVLSLSEWWFWETVCFVVGSFGVVPLCVHTIAYNLVPLLFMIPLGISIGLTVRMGSVLSSDVKKAKLLAAWCMGFTILVAAAVSSVLYQFRIPIAKLFSDDPEVIQGCEDIWPKLCCYVFIIYIFGINSSILRALGLQWRMAAIIFGCLWFGTLPTIIYFAMYKEGGLDAVWNILPCFYIFMQILLAASYLTLDWDKISLHIRDKEREHILLEAQEAAENKDIPLYPGEHSPLM